MDMTLMYKSTVCFLVFWNKINPFLTKNSKNLHVLNIVITVIITHYSYYGLINNKADVGQTSFFRHSISSGSSSSSDDSDNMPSKARHEATNARLKSHCLLCIVHSPAKPLGISRYLRYNTVMSVSQSIFRTCPTLGSHRAATQIRISTKSGVYIVQHFI